MMGSGWLESGLALVTAICGIGLVTAGVVGWFRVTLTAPARLACIVAGLSLFVPHSMVDFGVVLNGAGLIGGALLWVFAQRLGNGAEAARERA